MAHHLRRTVAALPLAVACAIALAACGGPPATVEKAAPDAGIQLFQLPWTSIADECENTLGPAGFAWVLTSPPQEHIVRDQWWAAYQPVSYRLESRLGTREEFADMVAACDRAGVAVIADAVINHMTGQDVPGEGWAGSAYEHYSYPGIYESANFHRCGLTSADDIEDYRSREQVQTCELVNLADLDTSDAGVRATIRAYLDDLLSLGVAGFRIDAAKHMAAADVAAIVADLPEGTRVLSEVIRGAGEPVTPEEYVALGEVFEFTYARDLAPPLSNGVFNDPVLDGDRPLHVPAASAVVFVDNHDTERGESTVTYRDGARYLAANALMLADDYGTPVVYSGYAFSDRDAGAPADGAGRVLEASCADVTGPRNDYADGERTCVQSWPAIRGLLQLRAVAGDAPRMPGVDAGDAYGFEREGRAVVAVNVGSQPQAIEIPTTLPDGEYCDVIAGPVTAGSTCTTETVTVSGGRATFLLAAGTTAGIHLGSRS